ncbi:phosphoadenylylsulfate reductase (thioredoxin) [Enhydrobacter aerosaccus]|uniref:Adenosine 5'-phosphosulfate reductase n=1 Tax=Enhydrobacter aerosaccus TaxID=225324 RepID=A0A1T4TKA1_9HYPH|nr:phosphoadenylyl-sulfate reductase [Enhydrobacter aerosaccus]SKA40669.1 phosphoadenylylsulfate reductase (thioredoxin) [Enhydrobacter aerosaccus]
MGPSEHAVFLQRDYGCSSAAKVLEIARDLFNGRIAVVSSFGAESAILLHLVSRVDATIPVLFIDTGRHFPETLDYRERLSAHLGLQDVRSVGPTAVEEQRLDPDLRRAIWDADGCCAFRKVAPLECALRDFSAWISGRKRFQTTGRADLPVFEADGDHVKINPLASMSAVEIVDYVEMHNLPPHPLVARGYPSIGCAPCTTTVRKGENARAGRWRGLVKTECGIHRPARSLVRD